MASAEREPIRGSGAEPSAGSRGRALVRGKGAKPPEAERKLKLDNTIIPLFLHLSKHFGVS